MDIQIGTDYRLTSDTHNFIIEERKVAGEKAKNPGEVKWVPIGYWGTLPQALRGLLWHELRESDAESILELLKAVGAVQADIEVVSAELVEAGK